MIKVEVLFIMLKIILMLCFIFLSILGLDSAGVLPLGWVRPNSSHTKPVTKTLDLFSNLEKQSFKSFDNKTIFLKDFKDKILIINFWASWCEPCKEEFSVILNLLKQFKGQVVLLAISNDFNKAKAVHFLKQFKKTQPKAFSFVYGVWDKNSKITQGQFKVIKLPESLIFGKNLKLKAKIIGSKKWLDKTAEQIIKSL